MSRKNELVTAAVTIACALGIGLVMQGTDAAQKRYGKQAQVMKPRAAPQKTSVNVAKDQVEPEDISVATLTVAPVKLPGPAMPKPETLTTVPAQSIQAAEIGTAETASIPAKQPVHCDISATARAQLGAMVTIQLTAPCNQDERVAVHHEGLLFTARTNEQGKLSLNIPALAAQAEFIMAFADGDGAVARAEVTDLASVNRFAIQFQSNTAVNLQVEHDRLNSDIDRAAQTTPDHEPLSDLLATNGEVITSLGDAESSYALLAQVYTSPAEVSFRSGQIDLSVKAAVTAQNCGHDIGVQTFELSAGQQLQSRPLSMVMPGCDAIGEFLVMGDILEDLKLASR